jgi:hypothetical protein
LFFDGISVIASAVKNWSMSHPIAAVIKTISPIGYGTLNGCVLMIDLDQQLVITQVRRHTGPRYAEWSAKFYQTIADAIKPGDAKFTLRAD